MTLHGARYIHILVTCPLGWGSASGDSIEIARLATETGYFPVFEGAGGEITNATKIRRVRPIEDYLKPQRRYAHLFSPTRRDDVIARLQARADRNIARFGLLEDAISDELVGAERPS
jgi:pyruvate ferredoxin oxidoreductase beta subunit